MIVKKIKRRVRGDLRKRDYGAAIHWSVRAMWEEIISSDLCLYDVAKVSGVSRDAMRHWKYGVYGPKIDNIEAVLNAIGYRLVIEKIDHEKEKS